MLEVRHESWPLPVAIHLVVEHPADKSGSWPWHTPVHDYSDVHIHLFLISHTVTCFDFLPSVCIYGFYFCFLAVGSFEHM